MMRGDSKASLWLFVALWLPARAAAFAGDDFSNNLFTDLGPVLALFGERVTTQFMSQAMGWSDNIILAMAPLGIVTIIVAAIRVGGPQWLKAIIGRARENLAVAEIELMSSTSTEVCELWNGHAIVRSTGSAPIQEFICLLPLKPSGSPDAFPEIKTIKLKDPDGVNLQDADLRLWSRDTASDTTVDDSDTDPEPGKERQPPNNVVVVQLDSGAAPNMSLNSHNQFRRAETRLAAIVAFVLQYGTLTYWAFATYYWSLRFPEDGHTVDSYAFPCAAAGTVLLTLGLMMCGQVVESSTTEKRYKATDGRRAQLVWLQQAKTVSDQAFDSYAVYAKSERKVITTSTRSDDFEQKDTSRLPSLVPSQDQKGTSRTPVATSPRSKIKPRPSTKLTLLELTTLIGASISVCGYVVQFVGLRGLHWSASIVQLGAVLAMMVLRAWIRRGLAEAPESQKLMQEYELDWFSSNLAAASFSRFSDDTWLSSGRQATKPTPTWTVCTGNRQGGHPKLLAVDKEAQNSLVRRMTTDANNDIGAVGASEAGELLAHRTLKLRQHLAGLAGQTGPASREAVILTSAIEAAMNELFAHSDKDEFLWTLPVSYGQSGSPKMNEAEPIHQVGFRLRKSNGTWKADAGEIEAALSLWLFTAERRSLQAQDSEPELTMTRKRKMNDEWLRDIDSSSGQGLRFLGPCLTSLCRDLYWYMPTDAPNVLEIDECDTEDVQGQEVIRVFDHRVVGRINGNLPTPEKHAPGQNDSSGETSSNIPTQTRSDSLDIMKSLHDVVAAAVKDEKRNPRATVQAKATLPNPNFETRIYTARPFSFDPSEKDSWKSTSSKSVLAMVSRHSTKLLYAKDLFYSFMWAAARSMDQGLGGEIQIKPVPLMESYWQSFTLRSETLNELAQHIEATGLFTFSEAFAYIIPPLSMERKLPSVDAILDRPMQLVGRYRRQSDWLQIGEVHQSVFSLASTFPRHDAIYAKAVSMLIEQWALLTETKDRLLAQRYSNFSKVKELTQFRSIYSLELEKVDTRLLNMFAHLYKLQRRNSIADLLKNMLDERKVKENGSSVQEDNLFMRKTFGLLSVHLEVAEPGSMPPLSRAEVANNITKKDICGWTRVHYAAAAGKITFDDLKDAHVQVNGLRDNNGWSPLHYACYFSNFFAAIRLVNKGAPVDVQGYDGSTPLHCAAMSGNVGIVRLLLYRDVSTKIQDAAEQTPLHIAAFGNNAEVVRLLWNSTEKNLVLGELGRTPLHISALSGKVDVLRAYEGAGKKAWDAQELSEKGYTPLHLAAINGHAEAVKILVQEKGAEMEVMNKIKDRPLHVAAREGHTKVIVALVGDLGADVEARNKYGNTALHHACQDGHPDVVRALIVLGADREAANEYGDRPLDMARRWGHKVIERMLLDEFGVEDRAPVKQVAMSKEDVDKS